MAISNISVVVGGVKSANVSRCTRRGQVLDICLVNNKAVCLIRKYQHRVLVRLKPAPGAGVSLAFSIWF